MILSLFVAGQGLMVRQREGSIRESCRSGSCLDRPYATQSRQVELFLADLASGHCAGFIEESVYHFHLHILDKLGEGD